MANITLMGASYADVPSIILPKTGGGTEEFFWGDADFSWLGKNVEDLGEIYSQDYTLEDTTFASWTPSTTAKSILATKNVSPVVAINTADYEYAIRWKVDIHIAYDGTETNKAITHRHMTDGWQLIFKRANSLANIQADNLVGNTCISLSSANLIDYYNASGSHTYAYGVSYSIYPALTTATFASSTANSTNLTIKTPSVSARCSTTYFSTANAKLVDGANSTIKIRGYLYRYKAGGVLRNLYSLQNHLWANPIT